MAYFQSGVSQCSVAFYSAHELDGRDATCMTRDQLHLANASYTSIHLTHRESSAALDQRGRQGVCEIFRTAAQHPLDWHKLLVQCVSATMNVESIALGMQSQSGKRHDAASSRDHRLPCPAAVAFVVSGWY